MPARFKRIAIGTTVLLVAGLGATGLAGPAAGSIENGYCPGMTAPPNNRTVNQAPEPSNDRATVQAGQAVPIRVLGNDSDPDGDRLAVVGVSKPRRGQTCVSAAGTVQFYAPSGTRSYTQTLTYGVTDGDRYRTATITVSVVGIKPVLVTVTQRLTFKKHGHRVKTRARVAFKNLNKRTIVVLAGDPKKDEATFTRSVAPGRTVVFVTKIRPRIIYVSYFRDAAENDEFGLVSYGQVNTRTGHHRRLLDADDFEDDELVVTSGRQMSGRSAWSALR